MRWVQDNQISFDIFVTDGGHLPAATTKNEVT
jgi:hypothetical protein